MSDWAPRFTMSSEPDGLLWAPLELGRCAQVNESFTIFDTDFFLKGYHVSEHKDFVIWPEAHMMFEGFPAGGAISVVPIVLSRLRAARSVLCPLLEFGHLHSYCPRGRVGLVRFPTPDLPIHLGRLMAEPWWSTI